MTNQLAKLDKATQMLAEAKTLEEVKGILDVAEAARVYARAARLGLEAYNHAAEVKVRAERKAGELLAKLERGTGRNNQYAQVKNSSLEDFTSDYRAVLNENEVPTTTAHRWQLLAQMPEVEFEKHIEDTRGERPITTSGVLQDIKRAVTHSGKVSRSLPRGKFEVIYADPPWRYENSGFDQAAEGQYPTMGTTQICELPVVEMASENSVLFLWVTSPLLEDGLRVLNAWGFDYKAFMVWEKDKAPGMGFWLKTKHEAVLIGSRGSFLPNDRPDSVFSSKVRGHSQKPDEFYNIIERMYPNGKKVELFSRKKRAGWESWGNEQ